MKDILVSIITPVYNVEEFLLETLTSVQNQTHQNYEHLLIIDSKSSDDSYEIAKTEAAKDNRIKVILDSKALKASANRNIGLDLAQGDYIAFLDADDTWHPEKIEKQLTFSLNNNSAFSFSAFQRMSHDGKFKSPMEPVPPLVTYFDILKLNVIASHTVLINRKLLGKHRFPNTYHEDFALWLDLLRPQDGITLQAHGLNEPLAYYRSVPGSLAYNKAKAALWRWKVLRDFEKLSLGSAIYYFVQYAIRATFLHSRTSVK